MREPRRGGTHGVGDGWTGRVARRAVERKRQHISKCRTAKPTFGERTAPAERQETAAAHIHELGQHAQLVAGEEGGLDAAKHDRAVGKELVARGGESGQQLQAVSHAESQELALGAAQQADQLQRGIPSDGPPQKRELGTRLAFQIQNPIGAWAHLQHRVRHVVLGHRFIRQGGRTHREPIGARGQGGHAQAYRCHFAVRGRTDRLRGHDAPIGFGRHADRRGARATHADGGVDQHRATGEHPARSGHPFYRDIALEARLPDAHGVHRHLPRAQAEQRRVEVAAPVVRAVGGHDDASQWHAGEFLARSVEGSRQIRPRAGGLEGAGTVDGPGVRGEAQQAHRVLFAQAPHQRARIGERSLHGRQSRASVHIGDALTARVVEQDGQDIALWDRRRDHQRRPQQEREHEQQGDRAQAAQCQAVSP